jgi:L-cysteine S-thiosulfotransferase
LQRRRAACSDKQIRFCEFVLAQKLRRGLRYTKLTLPGLPVAAVAKGGNMKLSILTLAATLVASAAIAAEPVAPSDVVFTDGAIELSLTGVPGNPEEGAKVFTSRAIGNCVACHEVTALDAAFPGNIGPMLDGVGSRWSESEMRGIVVNAKMMYNGTVMPSFYRVDGFVRPGDGYTGKAAETVEPILSAQQVEDVVAFLMTLTDE